MIKKLNKINLYIFISRYICLLILVLMLRYLYFQTGQIFYDYISYAYAIGLLAIILVPNIKQISFLGVEIEGIDNQKDIIKEFLNLAKQNGETTTN